LPVIQSAMVSGKWKPNHHIPHIISRIKLEITEIRVQRLQEITEADALNEGISGKGMSHDWVQDEGYMEGRNFSGLPTNGYARKWYIRQFAKIWNSINAKRGYSWETNPWVWAITFEMVTDV